MCDNYTNVFVSRQSRSSREGAEKVSKCQSGHNVATAFVTLDTNLTLTDRGRYESRYKSHFDRNRAVWRQSEPSGGPFMRHMIAAPTLATTPMLAGLVPACRNRDTLGGLFHLDQRDAECQSEFVSIPLSIMSVIVRVVGRDVSGRAFHLDGGCQGEICSCACGELYLGLC